MTDFSHLSEQQIIAFITANFHLFASERAEDFPGNVLDDLARGLIAVVRCREGFAVAYKGKRFAFGSGFREADLMFLYVAPEFERSGIGSSLIEHVKAAVTPGAPIVLQCEGVVRRQFFERRGFVVTEPCQEIDSYYMRWEPTTPVCSK